MSFVVGQKLELRFAACCAVRVASVWGISAPLALLLWWRKRGERGPRRAEVFFWCHSDFGALQCLFFFAHSCVFLGDFGGISVSFG